jgi:hypothetical protein
MLSCCPTAAVEVTVARALGLRGTWAEAESERSVLALTHLSGPAGQRLQTETVIECFILLEITLSSKWLMNELCRD